MKKYNKSNIPLAKELRRNMTPWERKLWYEYLRCYPLRFQRQKAIREYIADFYCAKARLIVELDGGGHYQDEQMKADLYRTGVLEGMNLRVLRFCNLDIDRNFRGVCEKIDMEVQKSLPQSASLTAPSSEGALVPRKNIKAIYALGFFDGVHLGHAALLEACRCLAAEQGCRAGAVTFDGHPDTLVRGVTPPLINTAGDRQRLLTEAGMEAIYTIPFDRTLMNTPWQDFFRRLVTEYGAAGLVCGDDFRFGFRGEGTAEKLKAACEEQGMPCIVVPQQAVDGVRISSTHIRQLLEAGQVEQAARFLGHPHILSGTVVPGKQLGRTIGVPTANLTLPAELVSLPFGVYACRVRIGEESYSAVTNIGTRPTVSGVGITVEPWILDFSGDLYGREITLEFHKFLRPEQKFPSLEALQTEIQKNAEETRKFFKNS